MGNVKIKKILIAGGAGFVGSHLANSLVSLGYQVIVLDNLSTGRKENLDRRVRFYLADITDEVLIGKIFKKEKPDVAINLAAKVYWNEEEKNYGSDVYTNILGTINLLKHCLKQGTEKFIFASSISVYGQPDRTQAREADAINFGKMPNILFSYGFSKYCAERYVRHFHDAYGLKYTILRYAHIYGPGQDDDAIAKFINCGAKGKKIIIYGDGEQCRDYLFIDDAVKATILAIDKGDDLILNIGSGRKISTNELVETIITATKLKINFTHNTKKQDNLKFCLNIDLARKELKWKPIVSLKSGIEKLHKLKI